MADPMMEEAVGREVGDVRGLACTVANVGVKLKQQAALLAACA